MSELVIDLEVRHCRRGELPGGGEPEARSAVGSGRARGRERSRHERGDGQHGDQGAESLDRAAFDARSRSPRAGSAERRSRRVVLAIR